MLVILLNDLKDIHDFSTSYYAVIIFQQVIMLLISRARSEILYERAANFKSPLKIRGLLLTEFLLPTPFNYNDILHYMYTLSRNAAKSFAFFI